MATATRERRLLPALPLATLIGRELRAGGSERPALRYGHAGFAKRGEDYFLVKPDCLRVPGDAASAFSVFAVRTALTRPSLSAAALYLPLSCFLLRPDLTPLRCLDLARQVFDGHNGASAAVYSKEHLLEHVMSALPPDIGRDDWLQALPRTLVAGFVKATPAAWPHAPGPGTALHPRRRWPWMTRGGRGGGRRRRCEGGEGAGAGR